MVRKATFTLDDQTLEKLRITSERLRKPKSEVVREAIAEYHERAGRLSESERRALLQAMDRLLPQIPTRANKAVDRELDEVRNARRQGERSPRGSR
ncbi:MAG: ribbon-helix-helix domain-containing protein [Acidobacteriota bacterium]